MATVYRPEKCPDLKLALTLMAFSLLCVLKTTNKMFSGLADFFFSSQIKRDLATVWLLHNVSVDWTLLPASRKIGQQCSNLKMTLSPLGEKIGRSLATGFVEKGPTSCSKKVLSVADLAFN